MDSTANINIYNNKKLMTNYFKRHILIEKTILEGICLR